MSNRVWVDPRLVRVRHSLTRGSESDAVRLQES